MSLGNAVRRVVVRGADCVRPGGATNAAAVAAQAHRSRMLPITRCRFRTSRPLQLCRERRRLLKAMLVATLLAGPDAMAHRAALAFEVMQADG